jgi:hypothetical protein
MIDMYASDLTHRKRAAAVFRNLQLQKEWFASGGTIRILGQKGGNDYSYMTHIEEGCVADKCWEVYAPIQTKTGNGPISGDTSGMIPLFSGSTDSSGVITYRDYNGNTIIDSGWGSPLVQTTTTLDDINVPIPLSGMDFFFNGVNYGGSSIQWNSNNALLFTNSYPASDVSVNSNQGPAILMGNYDRICSGVYSSKYTTLDAKFSVTKIIVSFSNYYTDTSAINGANYLSAGKLQIRLIKENSGTKRQWVEVGVVSAPSSPGYSNNPSVTYPSGTTTDPSGNTVNQDTNANAIDATKSSPWDITDGTNFLQIAGSQFSTAFPQAGTTILYESDKDGRGWRFTTNAYVPV